MHTIFICFHGVSVFLCIVSHTIVVQMEHAADLSHNELIVLNCVLVLSTQIWEGTVWEGTASRNSAGDPEESGHRSAPLHPHRGRRLETDFTPSPFCLFFFKILFSIYLSIYQSSAYPLLFLPFVVSTGFNLDFAIKKQKLAWFFFSPLLVAVRYCDRCQVIKPDRCHHCSACDM